MNKKIKGKLDEKQDMLRRLAMPDVMQVGLIHNTARWTHLSSTHLSAGDLYLSRRFP